MSRQNTSKGSCTSFAVGRMVNVECRSWPGINKPGGIGRIVQLNYDGDANSNELVSLNVRYVVVGGSEKRIPIEYVQIAEEFEQNPSSSTSTTHHNNNALHKPLRDRSLIKGRCKRCGSLRTDCGSCDWNEEHRQARIGQQMKKQASGLRNQERKKQQELLVFSSDEEVDSDEKETRTRRLTPRSPSFKKRGIGSENSSSSSSSSDEEILAKLRELRRERAKERQKSNTCAVRIVREQGGVSQSSQKKERPSRERSSLLQSRTKRRSRQSVSVLERVGRPTLETSSSSEDEKLTDAQRPQTRVAHDIGDPDLSSTDDEQGSTECPEAHRRVPSSHSNITTRATTSRSSFAQRNGMLHNDIQDDLDGFIQPEGDTVADSLPTDIEDRVKRIPFRDLPKFFDGVMDQLKNNDLPDAKVELSNLRRKRKQTEAEQSVSASLHEEADALYGRLTKSLIQEGVDQCKQAMKYMRSRRRYRQVRQSLTNDEKCKFKSTSHDARDLQLDRVNEEAEDVLRQVKNLVLETLEEMTRDDFESDSSDTDVSPMDVMLFSNNDKDASSPVHEPSDLVELRPFDPHQHATRIRRQASRGEKQANQQTRKRRRTGSVEKQTIVDQGKGPGHETNDQRLADPSSFDLSADHDPQTKADSLRPKPSLADPALKLSTSESKRKLRPRSNATRTELPRIDERAAAWTGTGDRYRDQQGPTATERMLAFLEANSYHDDNQDIPMDSNLAAPNRQRRAESRGRRRSANRHPDVLDSPEDVNSIGDVGISNNSEVVRTYVKKSYLELTRTAHDEETTKCTPTNPSELGSLSGDTANGESQTSQKLAFLLGQDEMNPTTAIEACSLATAVLEVWNYPLQETIATEFNKLDHHTAALCLGIVTVAKGSTQHLTEAHGVSFKLFAAGKLCRFLEATILQILDVLYATAIPSAWACDLSPAKTQKVLDTISLLVDAMGDCVSLSSVCQILQKKLEPQQWRRSRDGTGKFVSAIDPLRYRRLIQLGEAYSCGTPRLEAFSGSIPRIEIEAMWSLISFFGRLQKPNESESHWKLIWKLFLSPAGTLSSKSSVGGDSEEFTDPERLHRQKDEISFFCSLLASRAIDQLPTNDRLLEDLVKNSVFLVSEAEAPFSTIDNSEYRDNLPSLVKEIWNASCLLSVENVRVVTSSKHEIFSLMCSLVDEAPPKGNQKLHTSVLNLLTLWSRKLPKGKGRWSRFKQLIQKTVDFFETKTAKRLKKGSSSDQTNAFLEAFGTQSSSEAHEGAFFLKVITARLRLFLCLITPTLQGKTQHDAVIPACLSQQIWTNSLDTNWESCRLHLLSQESQSSIRGVVVGLSGLFEMAKIWLAIALFNVGLGWHAGEADRDVDFEQLEMCLAQKDCLFYPFSCAATIVHVVCDRMKQSNASAGSIHGIMQSGGRQDLAASLHSLCRIYCRLRLIRQHPSGRGKLGEFVDDFVDRARGMTFTLFRHGIEALVSARTCDEESAIAFRSCLSLLRSFVSLSAVKGMVSDFSENQGQPMDKDLSDEDMYGGIDDSVLLALDLGTSCGMQGPVSVERGTTGIVLECLDAAKPSNLFSTTCISNDALSISNQGSRLLHRMAGGLVTVLVALMSTEDELSKSILEKLKAWIAKNKFNANSGDREYVQGVESCFRCEACLVSEKCSHISQIIAAEPHDFAVSFAGGMLHSAALERFPSCDMSVMKDVGGAKAERRERFLLKNANESRFAQNRVRKRKLEEEDALGAVYNATCIWSWARALGPNLEGAFGLVLATSLDDQSEDHGDPLLNVACLESEVLKRLLMASSVVKVLMKQPPTTATQGLLEALVSISARELLEISAGFQYQKRTCEEGGCGSYKLAKLTILDASFQELVVGIFATISRHSASAQSEEAKSVARQLRDTLICPLLCHRSFNAEDGLAVLARNRVSGYKRDSKQSRESILTASMRGAFLRRAREILPCFDTTQAAVSTVVATALNTTKPLNPSAFQLIANGLGGQSDSTEQRRSQLQISVDEHFEVEWSGSSSEGRAGDNLRYCVEKVVATRLSCESITTETRKRLLKLLQPIMKLAVSQEIDISLSAARLLMKGIVDSLRAGFEDCDMEMIECTLSCSLEGIRAQVDGLGVLRGKQAGEEQQEEFEYIRVFSRLMMEVCSLIAYQGDEGVRSGLREVVVANVQETPESLSTVKELQSQLNKLEKSILADKENSTPTPTVRNIYAKKPKLGKKIPSEESWSITPSVRRAAKEYIAAYNSVT